MAHQHLKIFFCKPFRCLGQIARLTETLPPVLYPYQGNFLVAFFKLGMLIKHQPEIYLLMQCFYGLKVSRFIFWRKFYILAIVVVAQCRILAKLRRLNLFKGINPRMHFFGHVIYNIACKKYNIFMLLIYQVYGIFNFFLIIKAATVYIAYL